MVHLLYAAFVGQLDGGGGFAVDRPAPLETMASAQLVQHPLMGLTLYTTTLN
jgi:hypothetical protein